MRGMAKLNYEQHLSVLNLSRLYDQRVYNDMLIVYNVLNHRSNITASDIGIAMRHAPTRSNGNCLQHFETTFTEINNS